MPRRFPRGTDGSPRLTPYNSKVSYPYSHAWPSRTLFQASVLGYLLISVWVSLSLEAPCFTQSCPNNCFLSLFLYRLTLQHNFHISLYKDKMDARKLGFLKLIIILCGGGLLTLSHDTFPGDELPSLFQSLVHLHLTLQSPALSVLTLGNTPQGPRGFSPD